jgi:hypothetical protein
MATVFLIYAVAPAEIATKVFIAGMSGIMTYVMVDVVGDYLGGDGESVARSGAGAFLYLEVLDASFSFDGVIGAFAITNDIVIIMLGLGIGAFFVRSITVYLVEKGTLTEYRFLEHGAHYAIGALALIMLLSLKVHIPEVVTGLIGIALIALSVYASKKRMAVEGTDESIDGGQSADPVFPSTTASSPVIWATELAFPDGSSDRPGIGLYDKTVDAYVERLGEVFRSTEVTTHTADKIELDTPPTRTL